MFRRLSDKHRARDLGLAAAYTLVLTLVLAVPTGDEDFPVLTSIHAVVAGNAIGI